jgi:Tfp pilus assembly protein PilN
MRAVNLLPRQTSDKKFGTDRAIGAGIAVTMIVAAILAGSFFLEKAHAANERQQLAAAQAALAQVQNQQPSTHSPVPARLQVPVVLSQQQPWHVALDAALATRVSWDVLLRQLEYVVPDRVSITNVTVGGSGASSSAASGTITLGGSAFSSSDLAVFLSTLARVPNLSQVTLVSTTASTGTSVLTFQITAQMALPAALTAPPATDTTTTGTTGGSA